MSRGHCLAAPTHDEQQRPPAQPVAEIGNRVQRGPVRGVNVIEQDDPRLWSFARRADDRGDAFQHTHLGAGAVQRQRIRHFAPRLASSGRRSEASARRWGGSTARPNHRARRGSRPRAAARRSVRTGGLPRPRGIGSRAPPRPPPVPSGRTRAPGAFPDPGLPLDHGQAAVRLCAGRARPISAASSCRPSHERQLGGRLAVLRGGCHGGWGLGRGGWGQGPLAHLVVEGRGLLDRRRAQLVAQRSNALPGMLRRAGATIHSRRTAYQLAMGGLVSGSSSSQPDARAGSPLVVAASGRRHRPAPQNPGELAFQGAGLARPASRRRRGCRGARSPRGTRREHQAQRPRPALRARPSSAASSLKHCTSSARSAGHQGDAVTGGCRSTPRRRPCAASTSVRLSAPRACSGSRPGQSSSQSASRERGRSPPPARDGRAAPWPSACRR